MLKHVLISLTSILGVFLAFFLIWLFVLNDGTESNLINPDVQASEAIPEENQTDNNEVAETEQHEQQQTTVRSELKIVNVE